MMNTRQARTIRAAIHNARASNWQAMSSWTGDRYYKLFRRSFMRTDLGITGGVISGRQERKHPTVCADAFLRSRA